MTLVTAGWGMRSTDRSNSRLPRALVLGAVLLLGLFFGIVGAGPSTVAAGEPHTNLHGEATSTAPTLAIDPAMGFLTSGNSTVLAATWSGTDAGCLLTPDWYVWSVSDAPTRGNLNETGGSSVRFLGDAGTSGTTLVTVRSAVTLACATGSTAEFGAATARVVVVAPLRVQGLSIAPNPVLPGEPTHLTGAILGGEPPYLLTITWGDGIVATENRSAPGPFDLIHAFPSGTFWPHVDAEDSAELDARASLPESLAISGSATVRLATDTPTTEVGVPISFSAALLNAPANSVVFTACQSPVFSTSLEFDCEFPVAGPEQVLALLEVNRSFGPAVTFNESVVPALSLGSMPTAISGEVGRPTVLALNVTGGVPPFELSAAVPGNATATVTTFSTDGPTELALWPSRTGSLSVVVRLSDAIGAFDPSATLTLIAVPSLNLSATLDRATNPGGTLASANGSFDGGAAPYAWVVVPAALSVATAGYAGEVESSPGFNWSATFGEEGVTSATATVVDAEGSIANQTLGIPLVPSLRAEFVLTALPVSNGSLTNLTLDLRASGGLPPLSVSVNASNGEAWNFSSPADGTATWAVVSNATGVVVWSMRCVDQLGATVVGNRTLTLSGVPDPSPAPDPAASGNPSEPLGFLGLGAIAAFGVTLFWRRRRRRAVTRSPTPDPVATLRSLIEPADGADRATIELLAEEAGIPLATVRATIDRLVDEGTLRADTSTEGEEALSWSNPHSP